MRNSSREIHEVTYFTPVWYRRLFAVILSVLSLGIFFVIGYLYRRQIWIKVSCRKSIGRDDAKYAIVRDNANEEYVAPLEMISHDGLLLIPTWQFSLDLSLKKSNESSQNHDSSSPSLFESKYLAPCLRIGPNRTFAWDNAKDVFVPMDIKFSSPSHELSEEEIHSDLINKSQDDQMAIHGFEKIRYMQKLLLALHFLTLGFSWLIFYWKPSWELRFACRPCSLLTADMVMLTDAYNQSFVCAVRFISRDGIKVKPKEKHKTAGYFIDRSLADASVVRYITVQKLRYYWIPERQVFEKYAGLMGEHPTLLTIHQFKGLSRTESAKRRVIAGNNSIHVRITPVLTIIIREILSPFYMFQIFSCILWYLDEYTIYATCIALMSSASIIWTIYLTRSNERALRRTVHTAQTVIVCRPDGSEEEIMPDELAPGDVIVIPRHGTVMQCDAVLQCGTCIVNESMLTGESVPVTKISLPTVRNSAEDQDLNLKLHEKHILYCGTKVIQTRYFANRSVRAVVLSTGFMTAKGDLTRSILFPKPMDFKFTVDAMKFVGILALISGFGLLYSLIIRLQRGEDAMTIILRCLDLVTIVVPPALPIALSVGYAMAQERLKQSKIFCVSPTTINVCGLIDIVCFDKTGTLTEDGLDFSRVVPCQRGRFEAPITSGVYISPRSALAACMASCHSLAVIDDEITGDPIDLKMFQETGWELEEPNGDGEGKGEANYEVLTPTIVRPRQNGSTDSLPADEDGVFPYEVGILRQFPFSSSLQRMSVITRALGEKHFALYLKGAPEMVVSLCQPHTVPRDFTSELVKYTQQGYRVLGVAWKYLPGMSYAKTQRVERQQVENGLEFIGLLILENRLKPQTAPVIAKLRDADIRCLMVTGDNTLTALSVGRDCGLIDDNDQVVLVNAQAPNTNDPNSKASIDFVQTPDISSRREDRQIVDMPTEAGILMESDSANMHFAMTGKTWVVIREYFPDYIPRMIVRGTIFARFTPIQKQQLIESLQDLDYYVAMCGDGANDCGALKTAHAGISLSEAEASVASPFTSQHANIECVPNVIREGRAALVTTFGVFRFMVCYSLIQFISVCMLYDIGANLSDYQFLYIDLAMLTTVGFTFTLTKAYPDLVRERPPDSLIGLKSIVSLAIYLTINLGFQVMAFFVVKFQPWYMALRKADINDRDFFCFENYSVFGISAFQYISMAIVLSKGPPFRKVMFSNWIFVLNLFILSGLNTFLIMAPPFILQEMFQIMLPPSVEFRVCVLGAALLNFLICLTVESAVIEAVWPRKLFNWLRFCCCCCSCCVKSNVMADGIDGRTRIVSESWNVPPGETVSNHETTTIRFRNPQTNGRQLASRSPAIHHQQVTQQLARHPEWPQVSPATDFQFLQEVVVTSMPVADIVEDLSEEDDDTMILPTPDTQSTSGKSLITEKRSSNDTNSTNSNSSISKPSDIHHNEPIL